MAQRKLTTHVAAEAEATAAARWYADRSEVAAIRFVRELNLRIAGILDNPYRWPLFEADTRRALLHDFPYSVIYRFNDDIIEIVAIMHQNRRPGYWAGRD